MGSALAGIGLAMGALSSGAGVIGSIQQANAQNAAIDAQNKAALYNAQVNEQNAKLEEGYAKDEQKVGRQELAKHQLKVGQLLSEQRNNAGASGISTNSDTFNDITNDTLLFSGMDSDTILQNSTDKASQHLANAFNYKNEATGLRMTAANNSQKVSPFASIAGGLASGVGSTIKGYYDYKNAGVI